MISEAGYVSQLGQSGDTSQVTMRETSISNLGPGRPAVTTSPAAQTAGNGCGEFHLQN